jgi:hypothetical protein
LTRRTYPRSESISQLCGILSGQVDLVPDAIQFEHDYLVSGAGPIEFIDEYHLGGQCPAPLAALCT